MYYIYIFYIITVMYNVCKIIISYFIRFTLSICNIFYIFTIISLIFTYPTFFLKGSKYISLMFQTMTHVLLNMIFILKL